MTRRKDTGSFARVGCGKGIESKERQCLCSLSEDHLQRSGRGFDSPHAKEPLRAAPICSASGLLGPPLAPEPSEWPETGQMQPGPAPHQLSGAVTHTLPLAAGSLAIHFLCPHLVLGPALGHWRVHQGPTHHTPALSLYYLLLTNLFTVPEPRLIVKFNRNGIKRPNMTSVRTVHTVALFPN